MGSEIAIETPELVVRDLDDSRLEQAVRLWEEAADHDLALPPVTDTSLAILQARYRDAGFDVHARQIPLAQVRALPTRWAKRLAFSGRARTFVEVRGRAR